MICGEVAVLRIYVDLGDEPDKEFRCNSAEREGLR